MSDTPETDAVREMWFIKPNVELGDGRSIHGNVVDVDFARKLERERDAALAKVDELTRKLADELFTMVREGTGLGDPVIDEVRKESAARQAMIIRLQLELTKALDAVAEMRKKDLTCAPELSKHGQQKV